MTPESIVSTALAVPTLYATALFAVQFVSAWKREKKAYLKEQSAPVECTITERLGSAGFYMGEQIPKFVQLEDGRYFEFVSLAVKTRQGIYSSDDPDELHIKVDDRLLYKIVLDLQKINNFKQSI